MEASRWRNVAACRELYHLAGRWEESTGRSTGYSPKGGFLGHGESPRHFGDFTTEESFMTWKSMSFLLGQ